MSHSSGITVEPQHEKRKMEKMTRQELQVLTINKGYLDQDFPEHSKIIPHSDFLRIAHQKTFQKLCAPMESLEMIVTPLTIENRRARWNLN